MSTKNIFSHSFTRNKGKNNILIAISQIVGAYPFLFTYNNLEFPIDKNTDWQNGHKNKTR